MIILLCLAWYELGFRILAFVHLIALALCFRGDRREHLW